MPHYQAISRERHANLRWRPSSNYAFAAHEALVPLVAAELPKAMMSLPIAFTEQDGAYLPRCRPEPAAGQGSIRRA